MPYQAYLTDTDRAIDRDANEMLTQRSGYSGAGYLAQGYANMDVLPEQMALADMLERRQRLSMNSRRGRAEQAAEDSAMADQNELDGYSSFVRGTVGMSETERAAAMRDRALTNPSELSNPLINKARVVMLAGDQAYLDAKKNTLEAKRNELEMRQVQYGLDNVDEDQKLKDLEFSNARDNARLTQEKLGIARHELSNGVLSNVGKNIFGMNAFSDEERPQRDKLIKIASQLSTDDDPQSRDSLLSLMNITGGIATGNRVKELRGHLVSQNVGLIRNVRSSAKVDLANLPKDPAQRDAALAAATATVIKKGDPAEMAAFKSYVEKLKSYNDSEQALGTLKDDFFQSVEKIDALRNSPDPMAKQQLKDEMALLNAKASFQAAHFDREYQAIEDDQKRREVESQIAKRNSDMLEKRRSGTIAEQRVVNAAIAADFRNNMSASKDQMSRLKWAQKIVDDGTQDTLGLPTDADVEAVLNYAAKAAPPVEPGVAAKDF